MMPASTSAAASVAETLGRLRTLLHELDTALDDAAVLSWTACASPSRDGLSPSALLFLSARGRLLNARFAGSAGFRYRTNAPSRCTNLHTLGRDRNVGSSAALRSKRTRTTVPMSHNPDISKLGRNSLFATLIYCALLVAGFVYILGYTPGTTTGPRPTSAVTHVPPDETVGHR